MKITYTNDSQMLELEFAPEELNQLKGEGLEAIHGIISAITIQNDLSDEDIEEAIAAIHGKQSADDELFLHTNLAISVPFDIEVWPSGTHFYRPGPATTMDAYLRYRQHVKALEQGGLLVP